jgi:hypothetical protein
LFLCGSGIISHIKHAPFALEPVAVLGAVLGFGAGGRRRPVAGWAVMVGWAGREAEAQWRGERKSAGWKKKEWAAAGPKAEENYFRIKFGFLNIQRL